MENAKQKSEYEVSFDSLKKGESCVYFTGALAYTCAQLLDDDVSYARAVRDAALASEASGKVRLVQRRIHKNRYDIGIFEYIAQGV